MKNINLGIGIEKINKNNNFDNKKVIIKHLCLM